MKTAYGAVMYHSVSSTEEGLFVLRVVAHVQKVKSQPASAPRTSPRKLPMLQPAVIGLTQSDRKYVASNRGPPLIIDYRNNSK